MNVPFSSLLRALRSWRTASVALLSFSSGLPLGLILYAIPDWMRSIGVDIRVVGLITLAQAPWSFKFLWSPWMDRYAPPGLGRRRGWTILAQAALLFGTLSLAGLGSHPDTPWVVGALALAIAFASATQDVAVDAYAVDVLRKDEQGIAVGARVALYRTAMFVAGGLSITIAGRVSWPVTLIALALLYLPLMLVTWKAPEPEEKVVPPQSMRDAVWLPFVGFLARHRSLEILAFVVFYKLADNLAQALVSPMLIDAGYGPDDRGVARTTIGLLGIVGGTIIGGASTGVMGLGRSLWIFGVLQIVSNVGYALVADSPPDRFLMFSAVGFENFTTGLGTGAFSVLLLRMTQKRFSATQYALFSSLFSVPRIIAGPICGFAVDAMGWAPFFWTTIFAGIPGMILLARFVPWNARDPEFAIEPPKRHEPLSTGALAWRGTVAGLAGSSIVAALVAGLDALKAMRAEGHPPFDYPAALAGLVSPASMGDSLQLLGILVSGLVIGLFAAAAIAARRGMIGTDESPS